MQESVGNHSHEETLGSCHPLTLVVSGGCLIFTPPPITTLFHQKATLLEVGATGPDPTWLHTHD